MGLAVLTAETGDDGRGVGDDMGGGVGADEGGGVGGDEGGGVGGVSSNVGSGVGWDAGSGVGAGVGWGVGLGCWNGRWGGRWGGRRIATPNVFSQRSFLLLYWYLNFCMLSSPYPPPIFLLSTLLWSIHFQYPPSLSLPVSHPCQHSKPSLASILVHSFSHS